MQNALVVFACALNVICAVSNVYFFGFWRGLKKEHFDMKREMSTASK